MSKFLELRRRGDVILLVPDGGTVRLPDVYVSPAVAGWEFGDYALAEAPDSGSTEDPEPVITKADLLAHAAEQRWLKEVGGIVVDGMIIATDDRSKLLLQGARTAADADPEHVEGWKTSSGEWIDLDAPTIIAISNGVRSHVSACFALERSVADQIAADAITTLAEVEAAFA
jgi:hypothetical protein